jgi:hypothetical protein
MTPNGGAPSAALRCPKCLAEAGRYIGGNTGQVMGTYHCDQCGHVWRVKEAIEKVYEPHGPTSPK